MNDKTFWTIGPDAIPFGLGMAALGRPGYINLGHARDLGREYDPAAMQAHAHAVLDAAWQAGIRYYDVARSYGRAEEFLGSWLRRRALTPDQVTVASKWGYTYTAEWQIEAERHEVKEHSLPVLRRQWLETQTHLGEYLRLYQIHSASLDSRVLENEEVLAELARIKDGGTQIGLSLSGPGQADTLGRALDIEIEGEWLFDAVQATWNLLEPSAGPALAQAADQGLVVIVKEALANGRLTMRNDAPSFAHKLALLQEQAQRLGTTVDALSLAFVLAQPWISRALSGASTSEQISSNLAALQIELDDEALHVLAALAEEPDAYWLKRSRLAWN